LIECCANEKVHQALTVFAPILVPWVFVPIMCMLDLTVDAALNWKGVLVNVGWDTAVFFLGLVSNVFTAATAAQFYGTSDAILGAVGCFARACLR
jgi:hypothetical protein